MQKNNLANTLLSANSWIRVTPILENLKETQPQIQLFRMIYLYKLQGSF